MAINFLSETNKMIESCGYSESDIYFCQVEHYNYNTNTDDLIQFSYDFFKKFANFEYDNGYGIEQIPERMKIVFKDNSWIERNTYDGSEWWEYKKTPVFNQKNFVENPKISLKKEY